MKLIRNRGKLTLAIGIPIVVGAATLLPLLCTHDAMQEGFKKIRIGMTYDDARSALGEGLRVIPDEIEERIGGRTTFTVAFAEPDSFWAPGRSLSLDFYLDNKHLIRKSGVCSPTMLQIWNHWGRQLGF